MSELMNPDQECDHECFECINEEECPNANGKGPEADPQSCYMLGYKAGLIAGRAEKEKENEEQKEALSKINIKANAQTAQIDIKNIDKCVALQHYAVIVEFINITESVLKCPT